MLCWRYGLVVVALLTGCESPPPATPYQPVTDVAQLMEWILEPAAEAVWDSAGQIITAEGVEDLAPTTEAGWDALRNQTALLSEVGNLLMMPHLAAGRRDWQEISLDLVDVGNRARAAAQARDADALFEAGAALYQVCVSCHQIYWRGGVRR